MNKSIKPFDWHADVITTDTKVTTNYRNTQNVRRFFKSVCGIEFKFDRDFIRWMKNGEEKTMGEAASEWMRRKKNS